MRLRAAHREAKILAVEADAENYELLVKNCAGDSGLLPLHRALWSHPGELRLTKTWAHVASRVSEDAEGYAVRAVTVPELMTEYQMEWLDILKLDIEGAESKVFATADMSWLKRVRCVIFECCDQDDSGGTTAIIQAFERAGVHYDWHISGECLVLLQPGLDWIHVHDDWLDEHAVLLPHLRQKQLTARAALGTAAKP
jgi:FkbM family methyltransferase